MSLRPTQTRLEFDESGITIDDLQKHIDNEIVFYNHFLDQKDQNKWKNNYKLKKIDLNLLPRHLIENKKKYKDWFR